MDCSLGVYSPEGGEHRVKPVLDSLLFSIALAVGLTPQLLPAIININLSKGSQVMAAEGVIVRRLASIENFGSMDVLCTDKTGTLTEGRFQVTDIVSLNGTGQDELLRIAGSVEQQSNHPLALAVVRTH